MPHNTRQFNIYFKRIPPGKLLREIYPNSTKI